MRRFVAALTSNDDDAAAGLASPVSPAPRIKLRTRLEQVERETFRRKSPE